MNEGKKNLRGIIYIAIIVILILLLVFGLVKLNKVNNLNKNQLTEITNLKNEINELKETGDVIVTEEDKDDASEGSFLVTYVVDNKVISTETVLKGNNANKFPKAKTGYKYQWNSNGKNITKNTVITGTCLIEVKISSDVIIDGLDEVPCGTLSTSAIYVKKGTCLFLEDDGIYEIEIDLSYSGIDYVEECMYFNSSKYKLGQKLVSVTKNINSFDLGWLKDGELERIIKVTEPTELLYAVTGCVVKGTQINMADGTTKNVEDIRPNDMILAYNKFTGKIEPSSVITVLSGTYYDAPVYKTTLSNGAVIETVNYELVFDMDLKTYIPITESTYERLPGRKIMVENNGEIGSATILSIEKRIETVDHYSIYTANAISYLANGIVNKNYVYCENSDLIIGDDYKIDMAQLESDIEEYGYFTYEEFKDVCTLETFNNFNIKYDKGYVIRNGIKMENFKKVYRDLQIWIDDSYKKF